MRMSCPLRSCTALVDVLREQAEPGSAELVDRLAEHRYASPGMLADGQVCPASLMAWPLTAAAIAALDDAEQSMTRSIEVGDADLWFGSGRRSRHSLEPHPDADPRWFRGSTGMGLAATMRRYR
jgi:hypothetical protein